MREPCPSNFALDAFRLRLDDRATAHVAHCARCQAWLTEQEHLEERVAPLWRAPAPEARRPARSLWKYLLGAGVPLGLGVAALLLFVAPKPVPQPARETAKGGGSAVEIARSSDGALSWLTSRDVLLPNDALRFFVHAKDPEDRYVMIGSVDGSNELARFYPADRAGCAVSLPKPGEAMDGSITLDESAGPERIVVVLSHRPLCWPDVADAVTRFALDGTLSPSDVSRAEGVHVARRVFSKQAGAPR